MNEKKHSLFFGVISGAFLISGTAIGAGMLGFPLITGMAGFLPASFITIAVWLYMLLTGLLLLEVTLWMPKGSNILSISQKCLGTGGKVVAGGMYIFLYYCIMIAYFAAGSPILSAFFSHVFHISLTPWVANLIFGVVFGVIVAISPESINRVNIILTVAMIIAWIALLGVGAEEVQFEYLRGKMRFSSALFAAPILFSAFGYHNIVPPLCTYLNKRKRALRLSIFIGTSIPLVVYLLWQTLIMGSVTPGFLAKTLEEGLPVTAALKEISGKPWISLLGQFFAFFAIVTSTLGVSFSLVDFLGDGFKVKPKGVMRIWLTLLTFIPPFICATINPRIFDTALGIAGGFGEAFLNGLLPIFLVWVGRYVLKVEAKKEVKGGKPLLVFLILLGVIVIGLEIYNLIYLH